MIFQKLDLLDCATQIWEKIYKYKFNYFTSIFMSGDAFSFDITSLEN